MRVPRLVWTDLETTGLDETDGYILEVGLIITDENMDIRTGTSIVIGRRGIREYPMPEIVREMHERSGLLADVEVSDWSESEAEDYLIGFVRNHEAERLLMAGSNPQFDRRWLRVHMPRLHALYHYGNFDVHTLRRFFDDPKPPDVPHRSLDDLRIDIRQVQKFMGYQVDRENPQMKREHQPTSNLNERVQ